MRISIPEHLAKGHGVAEDGKSFSESAREIGTSWVNRLEAYGGLTERASILDIGCGPGRMAIAIGERFDWKNRYTGFDIKTADVDFAQNFITTKHENFEFSKLDIRSPLYNPRGTVEPFAVKFPCEDESFDFCLATSVFTHLYAGTVALYIAEAARCLRPKGIFFFTVFALQGEVGSKARFSFHLGPDSTTFITDNKVAEEAIGFDLGYLLTLLKAIGFDNIKHYPGGWTGNTSAIAGQDILVCEKSNTPIASPEKEHEAPSLPFRGFDVDRVNSGFAEYLSDEDLIRLNEMLPWKCFTADSGGRRFGSAAWKGKRDTPQQIPDQRIAEMNRLFDLKNRSVLEVGCFEGIHTIGLAQYGAKVYAIDSRIENVVKTIVRTSMFGHTSQVFVSNLEEESDIARLPTVDFVHHVGVLYHLKDPVSHLLKLANIAKDGLLLDTHYATTEMANSCYVVNGREYRYFSYREKGRNEVFSGMYDHAKWLLLDDIKEILMQIGFSDIRISKDSHQRNGPRVTLFAARPSVIKDL